MVLEENRPRNLFQGGVSSYHTGATGDSEDHDDDEIMMIHDNDVVTLWQLTSLKSTSSRGRKTKLCMRRR